MVIKNENRKQPGGRAGTRGFVPHKVRTLGNPKGVASRRAQNGIGSHVPVFLLIAVGILVVVLLMWHRTESQRRAEQARQAERARLEAQRAERERQELARREAEEKAQREKRLAEEREHQEKLEAEARKRRAEEEKAKAERMKEQAILAAKTQYKEGIALFKDGTFAFADTLPKDRMPGKCEAEFFCIRPPLENGEIIAFKSTEQGIASAFRLNESGVRTPLEAEGFLTSMEGKDALIAVDGKVYFQSKRKKPDVGQIPKDATTDLVQAFFGDVTEEVRRYDLVPDNLSFEIVFIPKDSKKRLTSEVVEAGESYSLAKVRDAVEDMFPMKKRGWVKPAKRFKRTVVLWDRAQFKKAINGVTYVPRNAPPTTDPSYWLRPNQRNDRHRKDERANKELSQAEAKAERARKEWQAKYDEAVRQEQQERAHHERLAEERKANADKDEREYEKQIDRIIDEGTLLFRAKLGAGEE